MSSFSLGHNGVTETLVHFEGDQMITEEVQDVELILTANQRLRSIQQSKRNAMRLAASVPLVDYTRWKREWKQYHANTWTWQTYLVMKLNSRDYSQFRTEDMRI